MIRLLHVITDQNIGGAGHQLLSLLRGLDRGEFDISVVLPTGARLRAALEESDILCTELPHLAEQSFSVKAISALLGHMKKFKPHIVHTHASLSARIAARVYGKTKIVHTRHSVFQPSALQKRLRFFLGLINNGLSDKIIAVSPAAKDNLVTLGTHPDKIHVIMNGAPPIRGYGADEILKLKEKYQISADSFILAQAARLTEVKGHDYVLDAVKNLPIIVLIAGDGERHAHLQSRIKSEGIKNVRLLGFISDIDEIFAVADAQISASFGTEATSIALIKGMSIGKPAVVTDFGGNPYVIKDGENGLVVPVKNAEALGKAVSRLTDKTLYARLSEGALKIYRETFTETKMISETVRLYRGFGMGSGGTWKKEE